MARARANGHRQGPIYRLIGHVQGFTIRPFQGSVNFVPAVTYHSCLNLPAAFSQPGIGLIVRPSTYERGRGSSRRSQRLIATAKLQRRRRSASASHCYLIRLHLHARVRVRPFRDDFPRTLSAQMSERRSQSLPLPHAPLSFVALLMSLFCHGCQKLASLEMVLFFNSLLLKRKGSIIQAMEH